MTEPWHLGPSFQCFFLLLTSMKAPRLRKAKELETIKLLRSKEQVHGSPDLSSLNGSPILFSQALKKSSSECKKAWC